MRKALIEEVTTVRSRTANFPVVAIRIGKCRRLRSLRGDDVIRMATAARREMSWDDNFVDDSVAPPFFLQCLGPR